jgi:hypothetical protein
MTFELVKGSGTRYTSTVLIDKHNANADLWWCERKQEYHWCLVWEDGTGPYGTHMHNGIAPTRMKARADIVRTIIWIEDMWPKHEYFDFAY